VQVAVQQRAGQHWTWSVVKAVFRWPRDSPGIRQVSPLSTWSRCSPAERNHLDKRQISTTGWRSSRRWSPAAACRRSGRSWWSKNSDAANSRRQTKYRTSCRGISAWRADYVSEEYSNSNRCLSYWEFTPLAMLLSPIRIAVFMRQSVHQNTADTCRIMLQKIAYLPHTVAYSEFRNISLQPTVIDLLSKVWRPTKHIIGHIGAVFTALSAVAPSEKSSINTNRKSTTRFSMSLRWTSYVALKPTKGLKNAKRQFSI